MKRKMKSEQKIIHDQVSHGCTRDPLYLIDSMFVFGSRSFLGQVCGDTDRDWLMEGNSKSGRGRSDQEVRKGGALLAIETGIGNDLTFRQVISDLDPGIKLT